MEYTEAQFLTGYAHRPKIWDMAIGASWSRCASKSVAVESNAFPALSLGSLLSSCLISSQISSQAHGDINGDSKVDHVVSLSSEASRGHHATQSDAFSLSIAASTPACCP